MGIRLSSKKDETPTRRQSRRQAFLPTGACAALCLLLCSCSKEAAVGEGPGEPHEAAASRPSPRDAVSLTIECHQRNSLTVSLQNNGETGLHLVKHLDVGLLNGTLRLVLLDGGGRERDYTGTVVERDPVTSFGNLAPGETITSRFLRSSLLHYCPEDGARSPCGLRAVYEFTAPSKLPEYPELGRRIESAEQQGLFRGPVVSKVAWLRSAPANAGRICGEP